MSLHVYTDLKLAEEACGYVEQVNDTVFNLETRIKDTELVREILKEVDEAEYLNETSFISRDGDVVAKEYLSTGTKTLLNILSFPERCFTVIECGNNALEFLVKINNGNVYWYKPLVWYGEEDGTCDIQCNGKHWTNIFDFLRCYMGNKGVSDEE